MYANPCLNISPNKLTSNPVLPNILPKYLRSVLADLSFPQHEATPIYEDNAASILIVNAGKPTPRTRHIDIQYFAIQEWKARGLLLLLAIAGIINIADALTKALAWILQHRHVRRTMGHHACQYSTSTVT